MFPGEAHIDALHDVFERYKDADFPALRWQFDERFDDRYDELWAAGARGGAQPRLWKTTDKPVAPSPLRLEFDLAVAKALGVQITGADLMEVYTAIVREMMVTRHLLRD